jgi:prepilin-type N-terminal cleavage/methylation domain-containing protein
VNVRRRGFSLIEVLCAVMILGIAIAGLTQGLTTALTSNHEAEIQTAATLLAAGQIETLRAEGYILEGETEGEGEGNLSGYKWKQNVTETKLEGLYEVKVRVERSSGGEEIYELTTLLFDPPVIRETPENSREKSRRGT